MGCTQSKDAEDSAAAGRQSRELQRSLEQVRERCLGTAVMVPVLSRTRFLLRLGDVLSRTVILFPNMSHIVRRRQN